MQIQAQKVTQSQSIILMKKLLQASIGSISYIRMLFPDNEFSTKGLDGIAVKIVNDARMNEYMEGIFEALELKYLKMFVFGIYNKDEMIENYEFKFDYDKNQFKVNEEAVCVQRSTKMFVKRLLIMTQNLEPLPSNVSVTMRLHFYPHTPHDYQPPHFKEGEPLPALSNGNELGIGKVQTNHHNLDLRVITKLSYQSVVDEQLSQSVLSQTQVQNEPQESETDSEPNNHNEMVHSTIKQVFGTDSTDKKTETIDCVCTKNNSDYFDIIECTRCKKWSHLICYGYYPKKSVVEPFLCCHCNPIYIAQDEFKKLAFQRKILYSISIAYKGKKRLWNIVGLPMKDVGFFEKWINQNKFLSRGKIGSTMAVNLTQTQLEEWFNSNLHFKTSTKVSTVLHDLQVN